MFNKHSAIARRTPVALAISSALLLGGVAQAQLLGGLTGGGVLPGFPGVTPTANGDGTFTDPNGQTQGPVPAQEAAGYARNGSYAPGDGDTPSHPAQGDDALFTQPQVGWPLNNEGDDEPGLLIHPPTSADPAEFLNLGTLRLGTLAEVDLPDVSGALFGPGTRFCSAAPLVSANIRCLVDRVLHATGTNVELLNLRAGTFSLIGQNPANLLTTITGGGLLGSAAAPSNRAPEAHTADGQVIRDGVVIVGWAGDEIHDDGYADSDLVYVVDAEPMSSTYGQVIWTAGLPSYLLTNNRNPTALYTSDTHNDPHHGNTYNQYITKDGRKLFFTGGLLTANMFRFDITDPRAIDTAELAFCGSELARSSLADDIFVMPQPNPETGELNLIASYMNGIANSGPGTLVEFHPERVAACTGGAPYNGSNSRQYLAEHLSAKVGGPRKNRPNPITGNEDSGLEGYPHGVWPSADGEYIASSDYAVSSLIGSGQPTTSAFDALFPARPNFSTIPGVGSLGIYGTTVRLWDARDLSKGPIDISQVPDGPRVEGTYFHEEDQGLMPFGHMRQPQNKGAFVGAMCGGTLYYTSNIRSNIEGKGPVQWRAVWDAGPCAGVSVFQISPDDRHVLFPVAGIVAPGDPTYERDYVGEHDRRINVINIEPLVAKGEGTIDCNFPDADPTRPSNSSLGLMEADLGQNPKDLIHGRVHNNGADDCPTLVGQVVHNTPENYASLGGGHYTHFDRAGSKSVNLGAIPWSDDRQWRRYCLQEINDQGQPVDENGNPVLIEENPYDFTEYGIAGGYSDANIMALHQENRLGLKAYCRAAWSDYFVDVDATPPLQGTGSGGDKKLYLAHWNPISGELVLDATFRDEVTGEVGLALMGPGRRSFDWPNRGVTGGIRPHGFTLEYKGLVIKEPYQDHDTPYHER